MSSQHKYPKLIEQMVGLRAEAERAIQNDQGNACPEERQQWRAKFIAADAICNAYRRFDKEGVIQMLGGAADCWGAGVGQQFQQKIRNQPTIEKIIAASVAAVNEIDPHCQRQEAPRQQGAITISRRGFLHETVNFASGAVGAYIGSTLAPRASELPLRRGRADNPSVDRTSKAVFTGAGAVFGYDFGKVFAKNLPEDFFEVHVSNDQLALIAQHLGALYHGGMMGDRAQQTQLKLNQSKDHLASLASATIRETKDESKLRPTFELILEDIRDYQAAIHPFATLEEMLGAGEKLTQDLEEILSRLDEALDPNYSTTNLMECFSKDGESRAHGIASAIEEVQTSLAELHKQIISPQQPPARDNGSGILR